MKKSVRASAIEWLSLTSSLKKYMEITSSDFRKRIIEVGGINLDNVHWRASAHRVAAEILIDKINQSK